MVDEKNNINIQVKPTESPALTLNHTDYRKILKGAIIAFLGGAIAQLTIYLQTGVVFDWRIWMGGMFAVGVNALYKWLQGQPD